MSERTSAARNRKRETRETARRVGRRKYDFFIKENLKRDTFISMLLQKKEEA